MKSLTCGLCCLHHVWRQTVQNTFTLQTGFCKSVQPCIIAVSKVFFFNPNKSSTDVSSDCLTKTSKKYLSASQVLNSSTLGEHRFIVETGHEFLTEMRDDVPHPAQDGKFISGSRPTNTQLCVKWEHWV